MDWIKEISEGIKTAMKSKDKIALAALRGVKKELLEAKSAKGNDGEISEAQGLAILSKMVKQRKESAGIYKEQGRSDMAETELAEVLVLERYLPTKLSDNELTVAVQAIIEDLGATSMKDMGKVMGEASKKLAGQADGKDISMKVRGLLQ